jgi:hypothetical protein
MLYNVYGTTSYKLVKNTRLATPDGRIYYIDRPIIIPGYTKSNGAVIPGSVEVTVTAALSGDGSNVSASDFSVPGLAGTPQAEKIYGRTKSAISGGVSGTVYTIPQDAANAALTTLQEKLKSSLISKAKVQVPDGYLYYADATKFVTDDSVQSPYSKTSDVPIALSGTLTVYLIKESTLTQAIAQKLISQYNNEPVTIPGLSALTLTPVGEIKPGTDTTFTFSLSGSTSIIWTVNKDDVKAALVGRKKSEFQSLLTPVVAVDRAELVMKPFWQRSFPDDLSRIGVVVKYP